MFSLVFNTKSKKTTLIFPSTQLLWSFYELADISDFRLESTKCLFIGKLQRQDIELAKRFGATEL